VSSFIPFTHRSLTHIAIITTIAVPGVGGKKVTIAMVGPINGGKSSTINTFITALSEKAHRTRQAQTPAHAGEYASTMAE
jgi:GTP-binding protein EngB required for normal cell division